MPVALLGEGNQIVHPERARYCDLWRADLVTEVDPSLPADRAAHFTVVLLSDSPDPVGDVDIDVLDARSAELVGQLCDDLHRAEHSLMRAAAVGLSAEQRGSALQVIESSARRWHYCKRAIPMTFGSDSQAELAPLGMEGRMRATGHDESSSATAYWSAWEHGLGPDESERLLINLVDREDAKLFDFLREQMAAVREFGLALEPWVTAGASGEPPLGRGFYEPMNVDPRSWTVPAFDLTPEAWIRAFHERGLNFDPASPRLEKDLADARDEYGDALIGRRLAARIAWSIEHYCARQGLTREDLRSAAAELMPAAAEAASLRMTP
ncbi:hypothetical protein [Stenotrophomonas maltophilia]|uniref:hypothetical protein n=1 Tax=Stenotrophomonas maltophilia TaxID=40324 RepID=UPI001EF9666F|nr:hypothetical protein [Stenotrophomonas maltophilia]